MAKEIKFGAEARAALERGVNQLADTVKVTLIKSTIPDGIIPIIEPLAFVIASLIILPLLLYAVRNVKNPNGKITIAIPLIILLIEFNNSELGFLYCFALLERVSI